MTVDCLDDADVAALGACAVDGARWESFRLAAVWSGPTDAGVAALTAALRRCPVLTRVVLELSLGVVLDRSVGPGDAAALFADGPLTRMSGGLRSLTLSAGSLQLQALVWPDDLAERLSHLRDLRLNLRKHRIDFVRGDSGRTALTLPPRLRVLHLDLRFRTGDTRWDGLADALAATASTLRLLRLNVSHCGMDDAALGVVFSAGIRPLRRLNALAVDVSDNPPLTDAAMAAAVADIPAATVEELVLTALHLPSVGTLSLAGCAAGCRRLVLTAGGPGLPDAANGGLRIAVPASVESVSLTLEEGTVLGGPVAFPATVRFLKLWLVGVRAHGAWNTRTTAAPAAPSRCRTLSLSLGNASDAVFRWAVAHAAGAPADTVFFMGRRSHDDGVLSAVTPHDLLLYTEYGSVSPASLAALAALLARAVSVRRFVLHFTLCPASVDGVAAWLRDTAALGTAAAMQLVLRFTGPLTASLATELYRLALRRSDADDGRTTVLFVDDGAAGALVGGPRVLRRLSALRGVLLVLTRSAAVTGPPQRKDVLLYRLAVRCSRRFLANYGS